MSDYNLGSAGMVMTRMIGGERVDLGKLSPKILKRIDMVVEMATRHDQMLAARDWLGLQELAAEHEYMGAFSTANKIRLEIPKQARRTSPSPLENP